MTGQVKEKILAMKYITVLDFYSGRIYQDDLTKHFSQDELLDGIDAEMFLHDQGFEVNNICYMVHEDKQTYKF